MPTKAPTTKAPATKAPGFFAQAIAPLASAITSSAMSGVAAKPQNSVKSSGSTAPQPTSGEVSLTARYPLIAALQAISGPEVVLSANNLMLVATTFPKS